MRESSILSYEPTRYSCRLLSSASSTTSSDVEFRSTDEWVAQHLREATPFGQAPRFLIRDRDSKYGETFTRVAVGTSIEVLKTPHRAPKANAICERFMSSVRRECLDHILVLGELHLYRVIREYVAYFNRARPHQGIEQQIPEGSPSIPEKGGKAKIIDHRVPGAEWVAS